MDQQAPTAIDWTLLHAVVDADPNRCAVVSRRAQTMTDALYALETVSGFLDANPECHMLSFSVERPLKYPEVCVAACVRSTWRTEWEDDTGMEDILSNLATDINTQWGVSPGVDLHTRLAQCTKVNSGSDREYLLSSDLVPECVEKVVGPDVWAQYTARKQARVLASHVAPAAPKTPMKM